MIYRILFEADKHWGALRPEEQYRSAYLVKRFLAEGNIDLYVNLGDYFDTKLLLNSRSSVYAIRSMTEKVEICRQRGIPIRAIKGTRSHDYDQWEMFGKLLDDPENNFRYFRECTSEETLPGLNILYCPEENMIFADYFEKIAGKLTRKKKLNMACMHGSFDCMLPDVAIRAMEDGGSTLIYRYEQMARYIHGPMVCGHWHDATWKDDMIYVGSIDRWVFGEDEVKGIGIVEYDTKTCEYRYLKVPNLLAPTYKTFELYTSIYKDPAAYAALAETVDGYLKLDSRMEIRIYVRIDGIYEDTMYQLDALKMRFTNQRRVHFTTVNQADKKIIETKKQELVELNDAYEFVKNPDMSVIEKVQIFIERHTGRKYTLDELANVINPYLKKFGEDR